MASEIKLKSIKTIRGRRFFKKKCPLLHEQDKNTLLITNRKGGLTKSFLTDMKLLKAPLTLSYELDEPVNIFEDTSKLDKLFEKFNSSLFMMGSHNKKNPNNMVLGRAFDNHVLDMYEFEIMDYVTMSGNKSDKFNVGSKPILIFTDFSTSNDNMPSFYLKTLLIDMFRGPKVKNINRTGLDYCIHFQSVNEEKILMSVCKLITKFDNEQREVTDVIDIGASCTLKIKRQQLPDSEMWKKSLKKPTAIKAKKQKNIEKDVFGNVYGRVHLSREDNENLTKLVADKYHRKQRKEANKESSVSEPMEIVE